MSTHTSRRRFLKVLASTATCAAAAERPTVEAGGGPPAAAPPPAAQALVDQVRARFGQYLTDPQMAKVREDVNDLLRTAEALRRAPLDAAEEPAAVFHADPPT
jgi:hypothetical protein